jgi:hypothetical protein
MEKGGAACKLSIRERQRTLTAAPCAAVIVGFFGRKNNPASLVVCLFWRVILVIRYHRFRLHMPKVTVRNATPLRLSSVFLVPDGGEAESCVSLCPRQH